MGIYKTLNWVSWRDL